MWKQWQMLLRVDHVNAHVLVPTSSRRKLSCSGHCQRWQKRGRFSFCVCMAHIKATRWWQCCCGQSEIPPAVSASTLELHAVMQSWLSQWDAALCCKASENLLPRLTLEKVKGKQTLYCIYEYWRLTDIIIAIFPSSSDGCACMSSRPTAFTIHIF